MRYLKDAQPREERGGRWGVLLGEMGKDGQLPLGVHGEVEMREVGRVQEDELGQEEARRAVHFFLVPAGRDGHRKAELCQEGCDVGGIVGRDVGLVVGAESDDDALEIAGKVGAHLQGTDELDLGGVSDAVAVDGGEDEGLGQIPQAATCSGEAREVGLADLLHVAAESGAYLEEKFRGKFIEDPHVSSRSGRLGWVLGQKR